MHIKLSIGGTLDVGKGVLVHVHHMRCLWSLPSSLLMFTHFSVLKVRCMKIRSVILHSWGDGGQWLACAYAVCKLVLWWVALDCTELH